MSEVAKTINSILDLIEEIAEDYGLLKGRNVLLAQRLNIAINALQDIEGHCDDPAWVANAALKEMDTIK